MKTTNVLLVSAGILHPPMLGRFWLRRMLSKMKHYTMLHVTSLETLPQLDLDYFQGMILYQHQQRLSASALGAFDDFLTTGGGVLAIHSATASYKKSERYYQILGGRFSSHGPVEDFDISPSVEGDEIFGAYPGFTTKDELYLHELKDDIRVHYYTENQGEHVPMVWTRLHGEGRVCYAGPGHRSATMQIPEYQAILKRGLEWVCRRS
jgi:type 1 glutamine amidotransferase